VKVTVTVHATVHARTGLEPLTAARFTALA
jgi:hypothetical protein